MSGIKWAWVLWRAVRVVLSGFLGVVLVVVGNAGFDLFGFTVFSVIGFVIAWGIVFFVWGKVWDD